MNRRQGVASDSHALIEKPPLAVAEPPDGHSPGAEPDGSRTERIREAACRPYEARGLVDGHAVDDWLVAEAEVGGGTATSSLQASDRANAP